MNGNTTTHHRRSIRLKGYDYSRNGAYFITICTRGKKHLFGQINGGEMHLNEMGTVVDECWQSIPTHYTEVELGEYVIMPNHLHGILYINTVGVNHHSPGNGANNDSLDNDNGANNDSPLRGTSRTVGSIIRGFKIGVTKLAGYSPWQRNYYEHIIRNQQSHEQIANYIISNPINWGMDCYYATDSDSYMANNDSPSETN